MCGGNNDDTDETEEQKAGTKKLEYSKIKQQYFLLQCMVENLQRGREDCWCR
jgi:hypothetical protein